MEVETSKLKTYAFNEKFFELLKGSDFDALKRDIAERGIKTELQILPDLTVICGNQRLRIAKELGLKMLPCKIVNGLADDDAVKEFVIKDNLLRRHLTPEKREPLVFELDRITEKRVGQGKRTDLKPSAQVGLKVTHDRYAEMGKTVGLKASQVKRDIECFRLREANPKLKGLKQSVILNEAKKAKQTEKIKGLVLPKGKFNLIVIDPPWAQAGVYSSSNFRGGTKYPPMTTPEIKDYPIPKYADEDCVLWLWGIDAGLKEALEVIEAWGFERKDTLIWHKTGAMGLGKWLRREHEYCFLCVKGKPQFKGESFRSVFDAPRREHSEKPDEFYDLITKASPDLKFKLDIFARKKRDGWVSIGDEVE